jgi:p-cumate 2,3-dioxygenase beta subunit
MSDPLLLAAEQLVLTDALLLDEWRLDEWLELFHTGSRYEVPSTTSPTGAADQSQYLISDDFARLSSRVRRLQSSNAHAEQPRSRLSHQVTNIMAHRAEGGVAVTASGSTWRFRLGQTDCFVVRYRHWLSEHNGSLRFDLRRVELVNERLAPGGRLSFIL